MGSKLKKILRYICWLLIIILITIGLSLGVAIPVFRERYTDKEIRIEQVDKKEEEYDFEHEDSVE